ncbi:hypothetical protein JYU34_010799 [Plutella xylostella]|uniref:CUB domain-containing protein n=1 Tax=Plutella xylostella TaxID=51655 RepID=A0ABQ7QIZ2_PLUXY|nr:hypothetical protein JYU34_010799 [Plutella xylostella]
MLTGLLFFCAVLLYTVPAGHSSSLLCGRTKEVELGGASATGALALALLRPPSQASSRASCQLRLVAPDAAAFTVRLIDVKESLFDWERGQTDVHAPSPVAGAPVRKWSASSPAAQDTSTDQAVGASGGGNATDACKLFIYIGESKSPIWRLSLCGANAAAVAARAGTKLLPPRVRLVWNPPTTPYHHTEKLRLVVTAVNSGAICNNDSQFMCGVSSLCISSYLACDGVRHCGGGEDEDAGACARRRAPPLLELLRRVAARNQELLGLDQSDAVTKPSVISDLKLSVHITEREQKSNALMEFAAALKPYGPWSYLVVGMLLCATILMFCLAWECCCKRSKPSDTPLNHIPASCIDLSPTVTVTAASAHMLTPAPPASPPEYEPPPSYSSLFPRAYKSSPTPVPHCSHEEPPPD